MALFHIFPLSAVCIYSVSICPTESIQNFDLHPKKKLGRRLKRKQEQNVMIWKTLKPHI